MQVFWTIVHYFHPRSWNAVKNSAHYFLSFGKNEYYPSSNVQKEKRNGCKDLSTMTYPKYEMQNLIRRNMLAILIQTQ